MCFVCNKNNIRNWVKWGINTIRVLYFYLGESIIIIFWVNSLDAHCIWYQKISLNIQTHVWPTQSRMAYALFIIINIRLNTYDQCADKLNDFEYEWVDEENRRPPPFIRKTLDWLGEKSFFVGQDHLPQYDGFLLIR